MPLSKKQKEAFREYLAPILAVVLIFVLLYAYSGVWPPMVVVESGSMQHGYYSHIGVIDTGDMVLVRNDNNEIITYVEGYSENYRTYGDYGDVIIFHRAYGDSVIHRAVLFLTYSNGHWSAPALAKYPASLWDSDTENWQDLGTFLILKNYGWAEQTLYINLTYLPHHDGFITKGDHNSVCDPWFVSPDDIIGVARGELPWFGLIKLYITGTAPDYTPPNSVEFLALTIASLVIITVFWNRIAEALKSALKGIKNS